MAVPAEVDVRTQLVLENIPAESDTKETFPVGESGPPGELSLMVTVQFDA